MTSQLQTVQDNMSIAQPTVRTPSNKYIHTQAETLVREVVAEFENDLRLQANVLARDDEIVLSRHVREALMTIRRRAERRWTEELLILIGSALLGAFLGNFPNELSKPSPSVLWLAIDVILGFVGSLVLLFGLMKQYGR